MPTTHDRDKAEERRRYNEARRDKTRKIVGVILSFLLVLLMIYLATRMP